MKPLLLFVALMLSAAPSARTAASQAGGVKVKPGELVVDHPTLINLGFEWRISGDDNHNASVQALYRKKGTTTWFASVPWLRLNGERVLSNVRFDVISPNMFAGSVLDLEADTDYEVQVFRMEELSVPNSGWFTNRQWRRMALTGLARKVLTKLDQARA